MLPNGVYAREVLKFLKRIEKKLKDEKGEGGNALIAELDLSGMLRHIAYTKVQYEEKIWHELLALLRKIWTMEGAGWRGLVVKNKLDVLHRENQKLESFLDKNQLDMYELWFQLIWLTYRCRKDLWGAGANPKAPEFAKRTGVEGDLWRVDEIISILRTWPDDGNSKQKFPTSLHYAALVNLQVLRKRREHVFEADELLKKAKRLYKSGQEREENPVYGMYTAVDIPAALALAEAINSAYTKQYAKTINLAQIAWTEASKLSMENPMRLLFMAWAASTLTGVYSLCDLQGRIQECKMFYPPGILGEEHPDWNDWAANLRREDFLPRVMLFKFNEHPEEHEHWRNTRGEAFYVFRLIDKVNKRRRQIKDEIDDSQAPLAMWTHPFTKKNEDGENVPVDGFDKIFKDNLRLLCDKTQHRVGRGVARDVYYWKKVASGLSEWLDNDEIAAKFQDAADKDGATYFQQIQNKIAPFLQETRPASKEGYKRKVSLELRKSWIIQQNKVGVRELDQLLALWRQKGIEITEIPDEKGRGSAVKSAVEEVLKQDNKKSGRRSIFRLFDGAGCVQVDGDANAKPEPRIGNKSGGKQIDELLEGSPTRLQRTALFNYISIQLTRLALCGKKPMEAEKNRDDVLDISRLEFRFLWLVHLMTWTGVGEPNVEYKDNGKKEDLIYRDLKRSGKAKGRRLYPWTTDIEERIKKIGYLIDDYEDAYVKIIQSDSYASRPLLLLMARMLNFRWYEACNINEKKGNQKLQGPAERLGSLLNKIMNEIKNLHPINLNKNWKYSQWFENSCGPIDRKKREGGDFKIDVGKWKKETWRTVGERSLEWLQEIAFKHVEYVGDNRSELRLRERKDRQVLLLLHPRAFSNPGK